MRVVPEGVVSLFWSLRATCNVAFASPFSPSHLQLPIEWQVQDTPALLACTQRGRNSLQSESRPCKQMFHVSYEPLGVLASLSA
jgi:hypothetical protein